MVKITGHVSLEFVIIAQIKKEKIDIVHIAIKEDDDMNDPKEPDGINPPLRPKPEIPGYVGDLK
jgi:hypothetical protein